MSQIVKASASSDNLSLDFLNPAAGFNTGYTIDGGSFTVKRIMSLISEKCGAQTDFRILSPAFHLVKWTLWASVRSTSSESDRQGSFDSCVEKQVDFVSWQNNVITGYIVGGLGFLALGALAWCYRDSIVGYLTSCCRRAPQYNAANQV